MLLGSRPLVGDPEAMPNLPEGSLPLEAQTDTHVTPTHCCGGGRDVLGSEGYEVGGLGCASLGCASMQHEAGLGLAGQQQDKVPKPIEGVGESIQGGDMGVPKGTSWGPKETEPFWKKSKCWCHCTEESSPRCGSGLSSPHQDAEKCGECTGSVCGRATPSVPWHRALGTHRGWVAHIPRSRPLVSSQQTWRRTGASPHAGSTSRTPPAPCLRRKAARWWGVSGTPLRLQSA